MEKKNSIMATAGRASRGSRRPTLCIKSGHRSTSNQCLLYPQKRTLVERVGMSASCQKRTLLYPTSFDASGYDKCLAILARHLQVIEDTRVLDCLPVLCLAPAIKIIGRTIGKIFD